MDEQFGQRRSSQEGEAAPDRLSHELGQMDLAEGGDLLLLLQEPPAARKRTRLNAEMEEMFT
jgi:hypothetical protein